MHIEQQRYIGVAEHCPLLIGLTEEADDFGEAGSRPQHLVLGLVDVLGCDQVEDNRDEPGVLDAFVPGRRIVDRDSRPENLPRLEPATRWMKPLVQLVDLVGEEAAYGGTEDPWKLRVQEMTQHAFESLAIAGVVGMPAWGRADAHRQRPPFF